MSRFITIGEAAKVLGITVRTLRRWESKGELIPDRKSECGTRYYDIDRLLGLQDIETDLMIGYAIVSSHDQKDDLGRQAEHLKLFCTAKGWNFAIIRDLGSGMNYRNRGIKRLLDLIFLPACMVLGATKTKNWLRSPM